jgi:hypothetical protein
MPAWLLVPLYGIVELVPGMTQTQASIVHFPHPCGMAGGWLVMQHWRGRPPGRRPR